MQVWNVLHTASCMEMQDAKKSQKIATWAPSHNFVGLYLRNQSTYQQSEKLVKQQYLRHMSLQYGKLRPTSGWDRFVSLGHPCEFQRVWRLGSITARHCSSGRQPNFAALNRGRHLYSAVRPSRWALAHISSSVMKQFDWLDRLIFKSICSDIVESTQSTFELKSGVEFSS